MMIAMDKEKVAGDPDEIGTLLELKGREPVQDPRLRQRRPHPRRPDRTAGPKLVAEERLGEIKGIGEALQKKITELVTTGRLAYYEELKASVPPGWWTCSQIPGLGPKKVKALHDQLGVETVEQLEAACQAGKVAELDGFGEKTQSKILEGIAFRRQVRLAPSAQRRARSPPSRCSTTCARHPDVIRCSTAGSLRRRKEIIGDIDFLVSIRSTRPRSSSSSSTASPAS